MYKIRPSLNKKKLIQKLIILLIRLYQSAISSALPFNHCRFYPSCSEYSIEAIEKYGIFRGTLLAVKRILKCHPASSKSGYDPVPQIRKIK